MRRLINKITNIMILLVILSSIGIVNATQQTIIIDVDPDNAGTVQIWKILDYKTPTESPPIFIGSTKTKIDLVLNSEDFSENTKNVIMIIPLDNSPSQYKFVKQCDHIECLTGNYVGQLYQELSVYKITAYYEIPEDQEKPKIVGITTNPRNPNVGDYINVYISATDNVGVDMVTVNNLPTTRGESYWTGQIIAREGTHYIGVLVCDAVKNCVSDNSIEYTAIASSNPTPNPTPIQTIQPDQIDKIPPIIVSIDISTTTPHKGNYIKVKVVATDNVAVTNVTADSIKLIFDKEGYWEGIVMPKEGTNSVIVVVKDAAGNVATDASLSYTTQEAIKLSPEETVYKTGKGLIPLVTDTPMKLKFGVLFVDSNPPNASIIINDKEYGLTPKALDISTGGYEVKVSKYGYNDYIKKIIVSEFETAEVIANMTILNSTTKKTSGTNTDVSLSGENDVVINEKESSVPTNNKDDKILGTIVLVISCILIGGIFIYKYFSSFNQKDTTNGEIKKENDIIVKIKEFLKKCKESFKK